MLKSKFIFVYENFNTNEVEAYDSLRALAIARNIKYPHLWYAFSNKHGKNKECYKYTCNDFRVIKTLRYFSTRDQSNNAGRFKK
jgi:hypothetical protein